MNRLLFVVATHDPELNLGWLRFWFSKTLGKEEGQAMSDLVRSTIMLFLVMIILQGVKGQ